MTKEEISKALQSRVDAIQTKWPSLKATWARRAIFEELLKLEILPLSMRGLLLDDRDVADQALCMLQDDFDALKLKGKGNEKN